MNEDRRVSHGPSLGSDPFELVDYAVIEQVAVHLEVEDRLRIVPSYSVLTRPSSRVRTLVYRRTPSVFRTPDQVCAYLPRGGGDYYLLAAHTPLDRCGCADPIPELIAPVHHDRLTGAVRHGAWSTPEDRPFRGGPSAAPARTSDDAGGYGRAVIH